jgi:hypothetical protein
MRHILAGVASATILLVPTLSMGQTNLETTHPGRARIESNNRLMAAGIPVPEMRYDP